MKYTAKMIEAFDYLLTRTPINIVEFDGEKYCQKH